MVAPLKEIGVTGLREWNGRITEDFLTELQGQKGIKKYDEMRLNSPVIGGLLLAIEQSIRSVEWKFTSELGEDDPRLEFLNANLDVMTHTLPEHLSEALTFLPFGYAPFEIVYQRVDGQILWRKFAIRGQDTVWQWLFDDNGGIKGFVQMAAPTFTHVEIPIEKLILYRAKSERNNPEGRSILRTAYLPYYYAKNIMEVEAIGIERDLAGLPMVTLPESADTTESTSEDTDYGKAAALVRNVRNDQAAGVIKPHNWEFELLSTGGTRSFDTDAIVKRYESRILMSALAQFLILGQDRGGGMLDANTQGQSDFFNMAVNSVADVISVTITKHAIPRLAVLNGIDPDGLSLEHTPAGDIDLAALGSFLQQVDPLITWTTEDQMWLRGTADLPTLTAEQIDAAKAEQRTQQKEDAALMRPGQNNNEDDTEDEDRDDNMADWFVTDKAPDDDKRRELEGKMENSLTEFLEEQKARVFDEAVNGGG